MSSDRDEREDPHLCDPCGTVWDAYEMGTQCPYCGHEGMPA